MIGKRGTNLYWFCKLLLAIYRKLVEGVQGYSQNVEDKRGKTDLVLWEGTE